MERHRGISMLVVTFLIYLLATSGCHAANSKQPPLDAYCSNLTSGTISFSSKPRLNKYQRICRDVDGYIACVLGNRDSRQDTPPFLVQPWERFFPRDDDLTRATYMFCSQNLLELQKVFDTDPLQCEMQCDINLCMSKFATGDNLFVLNDGISFLPMNIDLIHNLSCNILAPLTNCIEMQFVQCDSKYESLKDYELGKLGGTCLAEHNLHSPFVTETFCNSSGNSYSHWAFAVLSVLAVPVIWFVINL